MDIGQGDRVGNDGVFRWAKYELKHVYDQHDRRLRRKWYRKNSYKESEEARKKKGCN